ncbi:prefoldin subunit alpha [Candidatus Woesearchaeota archaeon]|nr:MAG: prefoldin subunit alpha [Candidatus Woesearchaeota archaeon]
MSNDELQQKYVELQLISSQLKKVQQEADILSQQLVELNYVKESLESLSNAKEGTDIMSPLGSGIFVNATLKSCEKVLMNVGGNVAVYKPIPEALDMVKNQIKDIEEIIKNLKNEYMKGATRAKELQTEMQGMVKK